MHAFAIQGSFGIENLKPFETEEPKPGYGQVLVKLHAASLNYRDMLTVSGSYNPKQPLPLIPLSDGAGEVALIGEGVGSLKVGDRVAGAFFQGWLAGPPPSTLYKVSLGGPLPGVLAEYAVFEEGCAIKFPEHFSYEQAATLPCAAVTAWRSLFVEGKLKPGETVLIQGTGGVSVFALQFAKMAGARVILTSSSDEKLAKAKSLGADETINYLKVTDWEKEVLRLTDGEGVDQVVEVGGARTLGKSLSAVRAGGFIGMIGVLSGSTEPVNIAPILMKSIMIKGVYVGSSEMFHAMNRAIKTQKLEPIIDSVHPFGDSNEAFRSLKRAGHFGKIVIKIV